MINSTENLTDRASDAAELLSDSAGGTFSHVADAAGDVAKVVGAVTAIPGVSRAGIAKRSFDFVKRHPAVTAVVLVVAGYVAWQQSGDSPDTP